MGKLSMLAAAGVGYVLGARAGRERYEQIKRTATRVKQDPRVQEKAGQAADFAREQAPVVKDKVAGAAVSAKETVQDKFGGSSGSSSASSSSDGATVEDLHPDSIARQDDPYPQGDLP